MEVNDPSVEFRALSVRLKAAEEALIPLVRRNIRVAVAPVPSAVQAEARSTLPKSGGANEWVAGSQFSVRTSISTKAAAGVSLRMTQPNAEVSQKRARARAAGKNYKGSARHNLAAINAGVLRHPDFGNRESWSNTAVRPGFFDRPVKAAQPAVSVACMAALREVAAIAGYH